jgi:hypothetical protein
MPFALAHRLPDQFPPPFSKGEVITAGVDNCVDKATEHFSLL